MNVGASFIPKPETAILMNPTDRPLHYPAKLPQAAAMLGPLLGQQRIDSQLTEALAVRFGVIRPVPQHGVGTTLGMPRLAGYWRNRVEQRRQLVDLVDVGRRASLDSGIPWASVITWCLLPGLDRSTGLGPVPSPP